MAKIETIELTNEAMHEAEEIIDECRAERFKYPKTCPECGGNNLSAVVPHTEEVDAFYNLIDGEWECGGKDVYKSYTGWDEAYYHCDDCDKSFLPTNENGWKTEAISFEQRLNQ